MKISLIIPVYNGGDYVRPIFESLRQQDYNGDVQFIFSDDGSTDNTSEELAKIAEEDPRVTVVSGENRGVSSARNRALAAAEGDVIGFVDADDTLLPNYLSTLAETLAESGADMVCCGFERYYEKSGVTDHLPTGHGQKETVDRDGMRKLLLRPDGYTTVMWNKLFTRQALTDENGELLQFDETLHIVEDGEYIFRSAVKRAVFLPDGLYRYAVRDTGAMYAAKVTERKLTELAARRKIVELSADSSAEVQALAKMKYQKGVRDLMFHAVIGGQGKAVKHLKPQLRVWSKELFESPALSKKEKLKYHVYRPLIELNLRRVGAFLMEKLSGH